ncbi:MAG: ribonuclease PH, partial [Pseudomonadota bacterium]|nr:ribonuclease PH [Pseudomonadota bacterium]
GICDGVPVADLDYVEDSTADTDANFVLTGAGDIVEIQATAEGVAFDEAAFLELLRLARKSIEELVAMQKAAIEQ